MALALEPLRHSDACGRIVLAPASHCEPQHRPDGLSQWRLAEGFSISASIFTMCSRANSATRSSPWRARNFSMMRRRALRVSSSSVFHSLDL